jgi:hypothetical protein
VLFDRFVQRDNEGAIVAGFFPQLFRGVSWEWLFGNTVFGRGRFPSIFGAVDSPGQGGSDALEADFSGFRAVIFASSISGTRGYTMVYNHHEIPILARGVDPILTIKTR